MQPQRPSSSPNGPQENARIPDFITYAEHLRLRLGVKETKNSWERILDTVYILPERPEEPVRLKQQELFAEIEGARLDSMEDLQSLVAFIRDDEEVPITAKEAVFRRLTQYLDLHNTYAASYGADQLESIVIPKEWSHYLPATPSEKNVRRIAEAILPMQYDVVDRSNLQEKDPRKLGPNALSILEQLLASEQVTMADVFACKGSGDSSDYSSFLAKANFPPPHKLEDIEAAKYLIGTILKHEKRLRALEDPDANRPLEQWTIPEAVESMYNPALQNAINSIGMRLSSVFQLDVGDIASSVLSREMFSSNIIEMTLHPLSGLTSESSDSAKERFRQDAGAMVDFFLTNPSADKTTVSLLLRQMQLAEENNNIAVTVAGQVPPRSMPMLRRMCEHVIDEQNDVVKKLLQSCLLNPASDNVDDRAIKDALEEIVYDGSLYLRDAFDLYYLQQLGEGNDALVVLKTVSLLQKHGYTNEAVDLQVHYGDAIYTLVRNINNPDILQQYGLSVEQQVEVRNLALHYKAEGVAWYASFKQGLHSFYKRSPEILGLVGAYAFRRQIGKGLSYVATYPVQSTIDDIQRFANTSADDLQRMFGNKPALLSQVRDLQKKASALMNQYSRTRLRVTGFHRGWKPTPIRGFKDLYRSHFLGPEKSALRSKAHAIFLATENIDDISVAAKHLKAAFGNDVGRVATVLATSEPNLGMVEQALQNAGYSDDVVAAGIETARPIVYGEYADDLQKLQSSKAAEALTNRLLVTHTERMIIANNLIDDLDNSLVLDDIVTKGHAYMSTELDDAYKALRAAQKAGTGVESAEKALHKIILQKREFLRTTYPKLTRLQANKLVSSGVCGLDDAAELLVTAEKYVPGATRGLTNASQISQAQRAMSNVRRMAPRMAGASAPFVISGIFAIFNERQINAAYAAKDYDRAVMLEDNRGILGYGAVSGGLTAFVQSTSVAVPSVGAIIAVPAYAMYLQEYRYELNKSTLQHFKSMPTQQILERYDAMRTSFELADPALAFNAQGATGKGTRAIRRGDLLHAYFIHTARVDGQISVYEVRDWVQSLSLAKRKAIGTYKECAAKRAAEIMAERGSKAAKAMLLYVEHHASTSSTYELDPVIIRKAGQYARLIDLKEKSAGRDRVYLSGDTQKALHLSHIPANVSSNGYWEKVEEVLDEYQLVELTAMRINYTAEYAIDVRDANENLKKELKQYLQHAYRLADARISREISNEYVAAATRAEFRRLFANTHMSSMMYLQRSDLDEQAFFDLMRKAEEAVGQDPMELYKRAETTNMTSPYFNVLKYAINGKQRMRELLKETDPSIPKKIRAELAGAAMEMRTIEEAEKSLLKTYGVSRSDDIIISLFE